jgi:four helix bundle protein
MPGNRIRRDDDTSGMLDHEKLDVYQRAIEFVACALRIAERLPRGQAPLADQLRRAAVSIPLNIAEGGGRNRESADRARFRAIARGSAMESGALLDVIRLFNVLPQEDWAQAKSLLVRVVEMLSKMC